ncbi:hypothetical protein ACFR9U_03980 [Halorientalis brevis]|uniref:DUF7344 domain-containing protein n=1 Tax=Halorientalis brevis TaxID=1126241 RepID=A0ABD6C9F8_9EURY|nr:hypothetical protein [Halorientalis brevis]
MRTAETPPAATVLRQYEPLSSAQSRRLVRLLAAQSAPLSPAALAVVRAVEDHAGAPAAVSERAIRQHRIDLVHGELPRLAASDLIEYDGDTATATDEGIAAVRTVEDAIPPDVDGDALLSVMNSDRRRTVASVLARTPHERVTLTGLAVAVATVEQDADLTRIDQSTLEEVQTTLHHVHLPKLDEARFVEYDAETRTIADEGIERIGSAWLTETEPLSSVASDGGHDASAAADENVWSIDAHEDVVERMRALADHADDELVVVLAAEGLLTPGCLIHLRVATERGVDVAIGTPHAAVRDRIDAAVPEATVWNPQQQWHLPSLGGEGRLSRLVVADTRAAMLATIDRNRVASETAVTGDGRDNGLVTAVRKLVDSRLDAGGNRQPDHQSPASP